MIEARRSLLDRMSLRSLGWGPLLVGAVVAIGVVYSTLPSDVVDLRADRLVSLAVIDGLDPHVPMPELAERYDSPLAWTWVHPRTSGALLLQLPLALIPEEGLRWLSAWSAAGLIAVLAGIAGNIAGVDRRWVLPGVLVLAASGPSILNVFSGAQSLLVAVLLSVAWMLLRRSDRIAGGVAIGVAITLKLFPWTLIPVLIARRRPRAVISALVVGVILNFAGLLFGGVSVRSMSQAILGATGVMGSDRNGSLLALFEGSAASGALFVAAITGLVVVAGSAIRAPSFDAAMAMGVVSGLCLSPLVWGHYLLVLIPVVIWMMRVNYLPIRAAAGAVAFSWLLPDPDWMARVITPLSLIVLAAASLFLTWRSAAAGSTDTAPDPA